MLGTDAVGSILSGGGDVPGEGTYPNTPQTWAHARSTRWRSTRSTTTRRTTSPSSTAPTSCTAHNNVVGTTLFPQQIGLGASFDPALVSRRCSARPARRRAATNVRWAFAPGRRRRHRLPLGPLLRVLRRGPDARRHAWPAAAVDRPAELHRPSPPRSSTSPATARSDSGLDRTPADMSLRSFQTYQLPSYAKADRRRRADRHGQLGRRSTASRPPARKYLLHTVLRNQLDFTGVTISDWQDVMAAADEVPRRRRLRARHRASGQRRRRHDDGALRRHRLRHRPARGAVNDHLMSRPAIDQAVTPRAGDEVPSSGCSTTPTWTPPRPTGSLGAGHRAGPQGRGRVDACCCATRATMLPLSPSAQDRRHRSGRRLGPDTLGGWSIGWQGVPAGSTETGGRPS